MKRVLFYIEKILLLGGLALILIFLAVKIHAQQGHSTSVNEVETLIELNQQKIAKTVVNKPLSQNITDTVKSKSVTLKTPIDNKNALSTLPDMSDWSSKRKKDYHEVIVNSPVLGLLEIPQIDLKVAIFDKASEPHLNKGVARVLQRAKLSGEGNLSLAGHRDGFFRKLGQVVLGDVFTVKDISGNEFNYQVTKTWIVKPKDTYVMKATEKPSITLITCYPFYYVGSAPERYIVRAERI
jgi:LPXTG-site transpeptidase (sortase) family protein